MHRSWILLAKRKILDCTNPVSHCDIFRNACFRNQSQLQGLPSQEKWDLYASLCLERKPRITKPLTPLEKKYATFLTEYELESSSKSDHEIRYEKDTILLERIKTGEVDSGTIQTAQDFEDSSTAELLTFLPMSLETEADLKNDMKSLNRALDTHLVLLVEQKLGNGYHWICPQLKIESNQTLRQTAERILQEVCPNVIAKVMGNAPWGFYSYRYPRGIKNEAGDEVTGAKVFFYKAHYMEGEIMSPTSNEIEIKDFLWLQRSELKSKLKAKYHNRLSQFLTPEEYEEPKNQP